MHTWKIAFAHPLRSRMADIVPACGGAVVALCLSVAGAVVHAQDSDTMEAPWMPDLVQAIDEYLPDPAFNQGLYYLDHFAGPSNADEVGVATALLLNGDIVVAGLVPDFGGSGTCSDGTVLCSIGLVRYNQNGVRQAWSNPGAYGHNGNQYVVYPGSAFGNSTHYQYIRDIKVRNHSIYVMVDAPDPTPGLGQHDVRVIPFHDDGSIYASGLFGVFGYATGGGDNEDFYGAQIALVSNNKMIVTATDYDGTSSYLAVNRIDILSDGSLAQDPSWGSAYGNGTQNRIRRYPANVAYTVGYAAMQVGFATPDDFYVAGNVDDQGNSDVLVQKISSVTGDYKSEFGGSGFVSVDFAQPDSSHDDYAAGLYVYQDDVYVGAQVARKCHPGVGMAKLNGATGGYVNAFGGAGKIVFGGVSATICVAGNDDDIPTALSATGGRIGIVGYHHDFVPGFASAVNPMLAVVDAVGGALLDFDTHPLTRADGTRYGDAVFYGVFGGPSVTSPFTVAGNGRDTTSGNSLSYVTGKFIPVSGDRIFASGFGANGGN